MKFGILFGQIRDRLIFLGIQILCAFPHGDCIRSYEREGKTYKTIGTGNAKIKHGMYPTDGLYD